MTNFKAILEQLDEAKEKFQCCGETTSVSVADANERYCKKCKSTWLKKESGWAKNSLKENKETPPGLKLIKCCGECKWFVTETQHYGACKNYDTNVKIFNFCDSFKNK